MNPSSVIKILYNGKHTTLTIFKINKHLEDSFTKKIKIEIYNKIDKAKLFFIDAFLKHF